jgi:hypothetical protein
MRPPLAQRDPSQLQGPDTVNPSLTCRNMPIRSYYPTSLYTTIGRSQYHLSIIGKSVKSSVGRSDDHRTRAAHDFGYCPLRLSEASGRLAYSRSSRHPASQLSSVQLVRSNRQILNRSKSRLERSIIRSCCLGSAQGRAIKTNTNAQWQTGSSPGSCRRVIHLRHMGHS